MRRIIATIGAVALAAALLIPGADAARPFAKPIKTPRPTATAVPTATPTATPTGINSVNVASIVALKSALADNAVDEIVVANGTYHISSATAQASDSLYIGSAYAGRTRPVTVRAATLGGVTFDAAGASVGMYVVNGAHGQTWDGFHFANVHPIDTGTIVIGGDPTFVPAYDLTFRHITLDASNHRQTTGDVNAQGIYFAHALGRGPHDILLEDITVVGTDPLGLWSAIHGYHGTTSAPPADHVTIRRLTVTGTLFAIVLWYDTAVQHDWLIDTGTITGAQSYAIRFESVGAQNITLANLTSTGSGSGGFYSSMGANPPGVTFVNDSLR